MPIFEYRCRSCGDEFELLVLGTEVPVCPSCEAEDLEKKLSTFASGSSSRSRGRSLPSGGG
jgi:putative FmdB family regulatory protein